MKKEKAEFHTWEGYEGFCNLLNLWSSEMIETGIPKACPRTGPELLRCDGCEHYVETEWDPERIEIEKIRANS